MAGTSATTSLWELLRDQHGVVSRRQLLALGYGRHAIAHRVERGRLHPRARGVYAVGRPDITWRGELMVAVLACGPGSLISHQSAAALLGIAQLRPGPIAVTVSRERGRDRPGIEVHRRTGIVAADRGCVAKVPVTSAARTLVDIAPQLSRPRLERAVNLADGLDLVDPERLRAECGRLAGLLGVVKLRGLLDRRTFRATDSMLEQRFLAIVRRTPLPLPDTQRRRDGYRVDFLWPQLDLVVETDSLRYHRTPSQQYRDRLRDQAHFDAGRTALRFTHAQVFYEGKAVARSLRAAARRLSSVADHDAPRS
jgi:very-short-patch-repair endonuclease